MPCVVKGASISIRSNQIPSTIPLITAGSGHVETVERLLKAGANATYRDPRGNDAINAAVVFAHPKTLHIMIERKVDCKRFYDSGRTLLHVACLNELKDLTDFVEVIQIFEKVGLGVNARANHDETPLHCAAAVGYTEIIQVLPDLGADRSIKNTYGRTPLGIAIIYGKPEAIDLLSRGLTASEIGNPPVKDEASIPVWLATEQNRLGLVQWLAESGVDVTPCNGDSGDTALHYVAKSLGPSILQYLLSSSPSLAPDIRNKY